MVNSRGEERRRTSMITNQQKFKLISLMANNPHLVTNKVTQDFNYKDAQRLWGSITSQCNTLPGAKKTWRQWRKCWHDMKNKIKKQIFEGRIPSYLRKLSTQEQEALCGKSLLSKMAISETYDQRCNEFERLDIENTQDSFDDEMNGVENENDDNENDNLILNDTYTQPEEKVFTRSQKNYKTSKSKKDYTQHSENCIFNCEMLAAQEQRKLQIKEDYYNFKKDYLRQKLLVMKEQTEALKDIARELAK